MSHLSKKAKSCMNRINTCKNSTHAHNKLCLYLADNQPYIYDAN